MGEFSYKSLFIQRVSASADCCISCKLGFTAVWNLCWAVTFQSSRVQIRTSLSFCFEVIHCDQLMVADLNLF